MNKEEKEFFYSIGRGSLNLNGKFYYGLDYSITDFMRNLEQENQLLKEDISFCLHSIKQEKEMSTDSRTRSEMTSCYEILKRWNK